MKNINIGTHEYEIEKDYNEALEKDVLLERWTEDFEQFDYIAGDYSYDRLRIKGFCNSKNKIKKDHNDYKNIEKYLKENCAYGCRYFILKKVK